MRGSGLAVWAVCIGGGLLLAQGLENGARAAEVELELVTQPGLPVDAAQQWMQALRDVGQSSLRVRAARPGDRAEIRSSGSGRLQRYVVVGLVTRDNQLQLPGGRFSIADQRRIREWVERLKAGGEEAIAGQAGPFGLTGPELTALHERLAAPVGFSTSGEGVLRVIGRIASGARVELETTLEQRTAVGRATVRDELEGVSSGTALATILRAEGFVLLPQRADGRARLAVAAARSADEGWPLGWPIEVGPVQVAPALFRTLNVEIEDIPLDEALAAIQQRVELPLAFDWQALSERRIDPAAAHVSMPARSTSYLRILDHLLSQAQLRCEVRLDEADQPFLWITPIAAGAR